MRYVVGLLGVAALSVLLSVGCSEDGGEGQVFPCTEQGIRDAIAQGGGPHTFDCDGPTTVVTEAEIVIDNDVILDGQGNLTVDGNQDHLVVSVPPDEGVAAELRGLLVTGGHPAVGGSGCGLSCNGGGIHNYGTLTLTNSTVSGNSAESYGGGILNWGRLTLTNSTVSGNSAEHGSYGGGILNYGTLTLTNSTVSGNSAGEGGGIYNDGFEATLTNSTVSRNTASQGSGIASYSATLTLTNSTVSGDIYIDACAYCSLSGFTIAASLIDGACSLGPYAVNPLPYGYNIESPGNTCGFDQPTDQVNVIAEDLNLGPLQDNGGPTQTHALGAGSVAIDRILAEDCLDADGEPLTTDQRGKPRPAGDGCDVGAFEVQP